MSFHLFDLGHALALGLAEHGASLVINGRNARKAAAAAETIRARGFHALSAAFDVSDAAAARDGIAYIESEIGPVDILVNNAGMQFRTPLESFPIEKWDELLKTNVSSIFYVSQAAAPAMIARGKGKIINIASVQAELARPGIAPYTATKGAVRNLTRGMATDWAKYGLQANAIAPGYFKTPLNQALVDDPNFSAWLENRIPAGRWGNGRTGRRSRLSRLGRFLLRQRPHADGRWRHHRQPLDRNAGKQRIVFSSWKGHLIWQELSAASQTPAFPFTENKPCPAAFGSKYCRLRKIYSFCC